MVRVCAKYWGRHRVSLQQRRRRRPSSDAGSINALSSLATALGSYAFSVGLAATLYQEHIGPGCGTVCTGAACYRTTFGILAALCGCVGAPLAAWVALRTRHVYGGPLGAALRFEAAEELVPEARWKVATRRSCLACCVCCGAWGRGLVVSPEEQATFGREGIGIRVGDPWDSEEEKGGLQGGLLGQRAMR